VSSAPAAGAGSQDDGMRAMVLHERGGEPALERRAIPTPGPGEALVRVRAVGIGVTNELARQGELGGSFPVVPGHELSGTIATLGPGVEGWEAGEAVTATFYLLCGSCRWCLGGRETLCERMGGYLGIAVDGACADYIALPTASLVRIPEGVELADAGIVADAVATALHVVERRLRVAPGERVAVVGGGGPLGLHTLQLIRVAGGVPIAVERDAARAAEVEARGLADAVVHAQRPDWADELRAVAGDRVAGVVDTVGSQASLAEGLRALGRGGTLAVLGHTPGATLEVDPVRLLLEEQVVTGTRYATREEIRRTLELVALGRVEPVVGARLPLERLGDALQLASSGATFGRILLDVS